MNTILFLFLTMYPLDLEGDKFILDHLSIEQYGIHVEVPYLEHEQLALANEWLEPTWCRAFLFLVIRKSYGEMDWWGSDAQRFFSDEPFWFPIKETPYQAFIRKVIDGEI